MYEVFRVLLMIFLGIVMIDLSINADEWLQKDKDEEVYGLYLEEEDEL